MKVVELAGGVGGAKLAAGLRAHLGGDLTVAVNTADDFVRHGLLVMPDHDTVMYTLAGLASRGQGWGIEGDTFAGLEMATRYGEEPWFRLGDRDLATNVLRTARLREGRRLTEVCLGLQGALRVEAPILPMADEPVRTHVRTDEGWLEFQEYFVRRRQEPTVHEVRFDGVESARPTPEVLAAIGTAGAIVIAPSNPVVSIAPILAVPGLQDAVRAAARRGAPVVAVSPIVAGRALRGPADRMLASLGHEASALGVARLYAGLATAFVVDAADRDLAAAIEALGMAAHVTDTVMADEAGRARLGAEVLRVAGSLAGSMGA